MRPILVAIAVVGAAVVPGVGSPAAADSSHGARLSAMVASTGSTRWESTLRAALAEPVGEDNGVVVVASQASCQAETGTLSGLRTKDGRRLWSSTIAASDDPESDLPVAGAGTVVAAANRSTVDAIDTKTGKVLWQSDRVTPSGFGGPRPLIAHGRVILSGVTSPPTPTSAIPSREPEAFIVRALDLASGRTLWTAPIDGNVSGLAADATSVYLDFPDTSRPGLPTLTVRALNADNGETRWQQPIGQVERFGRLALIDDTVVVEAGVVNIGATSAANSGMAVVALNATTGEPLWTVDSDPSAQPTTTNDAIISVHDSKVRALDPKTGHTLWETAPRAGRSPATLIANDNVVVVTDYDPSETNPRRGVFALTANNGKPLWHHNTVSAMPALVTTTSVYSTLSSKRAGCSSE